LLPERAGSGLWVRSGIGGRIDQNTGLPDSRAGVGQCSG
jgi:hypothetical protein